MAYTTFEQALVVLQEKALYDPLSASQFEYLHECKERFKLTQPREYMWYKLSPDTYVVEVLCDAAALCASPTTEFEEVLKARYTSPGKRRELFECCVAALRKSRLLCVLRKNLAQSPSVPL